MNPQNGEILAMVNEPDFNPNNPFEGYEDFIGETDAEKLQKMWRNSLVNDTFEPGSIFKVVTMSLQKMWRNSLVNDTFEPGSIFKVVTMSTAIEEGLVSESDTFQCGGSLQVGPHTIHCWKRSGHGSQILPEILQNSCNVGFMKLGEKIGAEKLVEYIKKFGFGQISGVDLPGEARGIIKSAENMNDADLATISFGQTNTVNAVQYMAAYNAIVNGGTLIQPHVMKSISHVDSNGNTIVDEEFEPKTKENVISEETAATLRDYLERTVNQGGSNKVYIEGYHVGAKTGTAQKVNPLTGSYESGKYISSMAGFATVENPQITVFLSIDEPSNGAYYAGVVTAPLGKILLEDIFNYLDSEFSQDENVILKDIVIPELRGVSVSEAKNLLAGVVTAPLGKILLEDIFNYLDSEFSQDENVILKDIVIPELRGVSVSEAKNLLKEYNLECTVEGDGETITNMKPYPGYTIKEGTTINLYTDENETYNKDVIMPDVRGYSKELAVELLDSLGIKYTLQGDGVVINQNIPSGEVVSEGSIVKLTLSAEYGD